MNKSDYMNEIVELMEKINDEALFIFIKTVLEGYLQ